MSMCSLHIHRLPAKYAAIQCSDPAVQTEKVSKLHPQLSLHQELSCNIEHMEETFLTQRDGGSTKERSSLILSDCQSGSLFIFVCLFVYLCLSVSLCLCQSECICLFFCYEFICLWLPFFLSICQSMSVFPLSQSLHSSIITHHH